MVSEKPEDTKRGQQKPEIEGRQTIKLTATI